jgi:hypothetical protein
VILAIALSNTAGFWGVLDHVAVLVIFFAIPVMEPAHLTISTAPRHL